MPEGKYGIKLSPEKIVIISIPIFVIALVIMDKYGIFPILSENQYTAFYTAIVTSLAAILAIVFAISLIAIQHAADKYTPDILERYKNDREIIEMYLIFSFSIACGVFALWFGWNYNGAIIAFGLLVVCLMFLYVQFRTVVDFVNPSKLIATLKDETLNEKQKKIKNERIRKNCLNLKEIAVKSVGRGEDSICGESVEALKGIVMTWLKGSQRYDERVVEDICLDLKEIAIKSIERHGDCKHSVEALKTIVMETLLKESQKCEERVVRKLSGLNCKVLLMLKGIGVTAAKEERVSVACNVVSDMGDIAVECAKMKHIFTIALDDLIYAISTICEESSDEDVLRTGIWALGSLGKEIASKEYLKDQTKRTIYYMYRISIKAAELKYYLVISYALQTYESIGQRIEDTEIIISIISNSICMCAAGIKNLSQEQDREYLRNWCFSVLNHFLENKDFHEYFDKAKEYCPEYEKEIGELKERLKSFKEI